MGEIPSWVLSITYWLHMVATVVWIGGMFVLSVFVFPYLKKAVSAQKRLSFLIDIQKKFQPIGWLCLGLLGATGMFQMSEHPLYDGFLHIDNSWAIALLIKHILILVMIGMMIFMTWGTTPALKRLLIRQSMGKTISEKEQITLENQEKWLLWANFALSIFVLLFTAVARSSM